MAQREFNDTIINVEFEETANRQELKSGDEIKTLFGKTKKFLSDIKPVAFSGKASDLDNDIGFQTEVTLETLGVTATAEELNYMDGVTSNVQTQLNNKANAVHSHKVADITDFPTSMPASDVSAWAKAASKPTYTYSEVGADASGSANTALSSAKSYTDTKIADLVNGAPTTLDTLGEIATAMSENAEVVEALDEAIGTKANASDLTSHINNKSNPHSVTKAQVGLGNVDNTADANKSVKYATSAGNADIANNLQSFTIPFNRPVANGGNGKQWIRFAHWEDTTIVDTDKWYSRALQIEIFTNGYGSSGGYVSMGKMDLCISPHAQHSFKEIPITIKWQTAKPTWFSVDNIVAVATDTTVDFFVLNNVWDTSLTFVVTRDIGIPYGTSYISEQYTATDFETYCTDKKVVKGIMDNYSTVPRADFTSKLQTYKKDSTTETYGEEYPLRAQWIDGTTLRLKVDGGYTVKVDNVTGTVAIANGGTGATTAKAAEYNILSGMTNDSHNAVGDTTNFAFRYVTPSTSQGTLYYRTANTVWNYIKSKISADLGLTATQYSGHAKTATTADVLSNTSAAGSATNPVYINEFGVPTKTTYTLGKSVPSNAVFTDTVYTLPNATSSTLGGIKVGSNLTISSGTLSLSKANVTAALGYTPPTTNTTYSVVTASANGLVPMFDAADGTIDNSSTDWVLTNNNGSIGWYKLPANAFNNTTYSNMTAATASAAGKAGLVPAPAAGKQASFLRGDGTWVVPTNTTYSAATQSAAGLMSAADKKKLDGVATGANAYSLPTASSTLGGVKTTSTVTSTSGLTACPIISGVPYYKDTTLSFSTTAPKSPGTASAGSATTAARSDHVHPAQTTVTGNAGSATKLATARNITIGNATKSFNGTAAIAFTLDEIGIAGGGGGTNATAIQGYPVTVAGSGVSEVESACLTFNNITAGNTNFTFTGDEFFIYSPSSAYLDGHMTNWTCLNGSGATVTTDATTHFMSLKSGTTNAVHWYRTTNTVNFANYVNKGYTKFAIICMATGSTMTGASSYSNISSEVVLKTGNALSSASILSYAPTASVGNYGYGFNPNPMSKANSYDLSTYNGTYYIFVRLTPNSYSTTTLSSSEVRVALVFY